MKVARKTLRELNSKSIVADELARAKFVNSFDMSGARLRKFLNPKKLFSLLSKSFIFKHGMTFKTKASHLLPVKVKHGRSFGIGKASPTGDSLSRR